MVENEQIPVKQDILQQHTKLMLRKMYRLKAISIMQEIESMGYIIDSEFKKVFVKYRIEKYELVKMPLKDLFVDDWQDKNKGSVVKIKDSPNYKYLSGDKSLYISRCKNEPTHSCESFDNLIANLNQKNYDQKNLIITKQNNVIIDGAHRASWLMYKYGENYDVTILKLYIENKHANIH